VRKTSSNAAEQGKSLGDERALVCLGEGAARAT